MSRAAKVAAITLAVGLFSSSFALAEETGATAESEGQRLFREGREALAKSELELACNKFKESYATEKAIGPLLNLANCEENRGRLVSARELWLAARSLPMDDPELATYAETRLASLEPNVPRVLIELEPGSAPDARVEVDGAQVTLSALPQYLDPGEHTIAGRAGSSETLKKITLQRGQLLVVKLLVEPPPPPRSEEAWIAGWIVGGVGVAGAIGFAITGGIILGKASEWADLGCLERVTPTCDSMRPGDALYVANAVLGGLGLVGAGVGVILLALNAPAADEPVQPATVVLVPGPGEFGLAFEVRW